MRVEDMSAYCDILKAASILKGEQSSGVSPIPIDTINGICREILIDILAAIDIKDFYKIQSRVANKILALGY